MSTPNEIWTADFKGQFRTRDGLYCYPLTIADGFSRYLIRCQALTSTAHDTAAAVFKSAFNEHGLPNIIRTDNGVPFATTAIARLSRLSVWWIRLGIYPELIELGHPEQNGRHERMHKTLKAETTRPPAANRAAQQRKFNRFLDEFNCVRPHEALDQKLDSFIRNKLFSINPILLDLMPEDTLEAIKQRLISELAPYIPLLLQDLSKSLEERMDFKEVVVERITEFDIERFEDIVLRIARKELRHIELLGGVLGFIVGLAQVLIWGLL